MPRARRLGLDRDHRADVALIVLREAYLAALVTSTSPIDKMVCTRGWQAAPGVNH